MKDAQAVAHLRQLSLLGLGGTAVMPAVLRSIRSLVACDSAAFFWADEAGEWSNLYAERMLAPALMRRYFEHYYAAGQQSFRERMRACAAAKQSLVDIETPAENSPYFQEILRPLDACRILHLCLQENGRPLGQLSLYRARRWAPYSALDREALGSLARYLTAALQPATEPAPTLNGETYRDSDEGALVVCTPQGELIAASHRAHALLAHATGNPINRGSLAGAIEERIRSMIRGLSAGLGSTAPLHETTPSTSVDNAWGRFRLRAYALGEFELGVLIHRQDHLLVRMVEAMPRLGLSIQQREVAVMLARGWTNADIADQLGVTFNTASYHVRQLFQKLDAHDRGEAIVRILHSI